ncbi:hypothetical protein GJ699_22605 [Duganella sp. FT80W]|uniref:Uncharacterized protein n=1 Tax=Duganella guangzhouensis TaxID=2666084 RepID=A0A6I2L7E3_9BURK|nr:hypothetical protein [Duganella guangzhouensis]MRW92794.1 hypothetical protein [Duganella guangzhouensis]
MTKQLTALLLCCGLLNSASAQDAPPASCAYDRAQMLALDETQFDQMPSGWRSLEAKPECAVVAADLLRDYQQAHQSESGLLFWHEAQLRADAGQDAAAIALMEKSRKPASADTGDWNPYVDATIAFLRKDRAALEQARASLLAFQPPPGADLPPIVNGYIELDFADGQKRKIRWPPNIDVVDGLIACFDKPYTEAYGGDCRERAAP